MNPIASFGPIADAVRRRGAQRRTTTIVQVGAPQNKPPEEVPGVKKTIVQRALQPFRQRAFSSPELFREICVYQVETLEGERLISVDHAQGAEILIRRNLGFSLERQPPSRLRVVAPSGEVRIFSYIAAPHELVIPAVDGDVTVRFESAPGANLELRDGVIVGLFRSEILSPLKPEEAAPAPGSSGSKVGRLFSK